MFIYQKLGELNKDYNKVHQSCENVQTSWSKGGCGKSRQVWKSTLSTGNIKYILMSFHCLLIRFYIM